MSIFTEIKYKKSSTNKKGNVEFNIPSDFMNKHVSYWDMV